MKNSILVAVDRWHLNRKYKVKVKRTSKIMVNSRSSPSEPAVLHSLARGARLPHNAQILRRTALSAMRRSLHFAGS